MKKMKQWGIKDPGSALTHFIAMVLSLAALVPLLIRGSADPQPVRMVSLAVFGSSMILLYLASTLHHSLSLGERGYRLLKKIDHMMIFVLIAGTYTPICLIALADTSGPWLLALVWGIALAGILIKGFWINCPKWFSSLLYIAMGWVCMLAFVQIWNALRGPAFWWLLAGGVIYTVGGVIYALKLSLFNGKHPYFGSHEIFHLFVMAGSFCHFYMIYQYVAVMPVG